MKKIMFFIAATLSLSLHAQSFQGCGSYLFKGIMKEDQSFTNKMAYVVNEGTQSEMKFDVPAMDDLSGLALMLNVASSFEGSISTPMDGTKGSVKSPTKISRRFPDPLNASSTGITKISDEKCD